MSQNMNQDKCTIVVDGRELDARPGQMLIEVTDAAGIYIPRFCYHSKLSIAANCRMCLVEVENAPKPLPACATPVTPNMKVSTSSTKAVGAQKATMEFLLINHPLDCPICDQGGECELQDLAMGFGRDVSRYSERKRVVKDKDIGPLVSTDMTRCIHCTRCVRFTQEIAGFQELGTIGRGDRVEIAPYLERTVNHELSGNIIDLCPVGALNSKPFRFSARAWEMTARPLIATHDCVGSNLYAHTLGGQVKRVVPRDCEAVNETWISDRDRFSYEGLYTDDRLTEPLLRDESGWRAASWDEALDRVAERIRAAVASYGGAGFGALVSSNAPVEAGYLLNRIAEQLGSANLDHRLRRRDFRGQAGEPVTPGLGMTIDALERLEQVLVVGSNLRAEAPLLAHRVRKAAVHGAGVHFVNPARYPCLFPVGCYFAGTPDDFWQELATLLRATGDTSLSPAIAELVARAPAPTEAHTQLVTQLREAERSTVLIGQIAQRHPRFAEIRLLANELARVTGSSSGGITEGANSAGLALAGVLPHRSVAGRPRAQAGQDAAQMLGNPPRSLLVFDIEPDLDCAGGETLAARRAAIDCIVVCSPWLSDWARTHADVILPIGAAHETEGTWVNAEGRWQSANAATAPPGDARAGWKVLRVLANRLGVTDSDYDNAAAICAELRALTTGSAPEPAVITAALPAVAARAITLAELDVPMYRIDGLVRRAAPLQNTEDALVQAAGGATRRRA